MSSLKSIEQTHIGGSLPTTSTGELTPPYGANNPSYGVNNLNPTGKQPSGYEPDTFSTLTKLACSPNSEGSYNRGCLLSVKVRALTSCR